MRVMPCVKLRWAPPLLKPAQKERYVTLEQSNATRDILELGCRRVAYQAATSNSKGVVLFVTRRLYLAVVCSQATYVLPTGEFCMYSSSDMHRK